MSSKRLFPGTNEQDITTKEQQILAKLSEEQKRQEEKNERIRRNKMYSKYLTTTLHNPIPMSKTIKRIAIGCFYIAFFTFAAGNFCWLWWGATDLDDNGERNSLKTPYKTALRDAYWPIKNGKINLTYGWAANVLIAVIMTIAASNEIKETKKENNKIISERQAIDLMADFKPDTLYKLTPEQMTLLTSVATEIIENMSADSRVYFDMIINNKIEAENKENLLKFATSIMEGHLIEHPEDINKVLSVFDLRSIPEQLLTKYKQHIK